MLRVNRVVTCTDHRVIVINRADMKKSKKGEAIRLPLKKRNIQLTFQTQVIISASPEPYHNANYALWFNVLYKLLMKASGSLMEKVFSCSLHAI